jgi:hypothetical protein
MMFFKSCPKCCGDFIVEEDLTGGLPDFTCIQCGYRARPIEQVTLLNRLFGRRNPVLATARAEVPLRRRMS